MKKLELTPQQVFNFIGYRFNLKTGRILLTQDRFCPERKVTVPQEPDFLLSPSVHISDRSPHGNGEAGVVRSSSHEAHPVVLEETLACSGKDHSSSPVSPSSPRLVVA